MGGGALRDMRVLIVEDEALLALQVGDIIISNGGVVAGTAASIAQAWQMVDSLELDVAVMDIQLVDGMAFPIARRLLDRGASVVFWTSHQADFIPAEFAAIPRVEKLAADLELAAAIGTARPRLAEQPPPR